MDDPKRGILKTPRSYQRLPQSKLLRRTGNSESLWNLLHSAGSGDGSPLEASISSSGVEYILSWSYFPLCVDAEIAH